MLLGEEGGGAYEADFAAPGGGYGRHAGGGEREDVRDRGGVEDGVVAFEEAGDVGGDSPVVLGVA